jgi:hypothetical protein
MSITLRTTLCETRDALHVLRKALFLGSHMEAMEGIHSLIAVAEDEAVHAISAIDRAEIRKPVLVAIANSVEPSDIVVPLVQPTRLGELRKLGMGLSAYCGNARCGHLRTLDLDELIETYGTHYDFVLGRRLTSKLVCKRCRHVGGRLVVVSDKRPRY